MTKKLREVVPPKPKKKKDLYVPFFAGIRKDQCPDLEPVKIKEEVDKPIKKPFNYEIGEMHPLLTHSFTGKPDHVRDYSDVEKRHHDLGGQMSFSNLHKNAIKEYSRSSRPMNTALLKNGGDLSSVGTTMKGNTYISDKEAYTGHEMANHLSDAIRSNKISHDMHVYSGVSFNPSDKFKKPEGKDHFVGKMPAFTSTSTNPRSAHHFANSDVGDGPGHMLSIHVPKDSHGAYTAHHSNFVTEREFILHPNSRLHIHPEPTVYHHTDDRGVKHATHIWHSRLVHDGVQPTSNMPEGDN